MENTLILVAVIVLGLISGSFLTSFIDRFHDGRNYMTGRSACNNCHKKLGFIDLVPLLSWLFLRGRCRRCQKKIGFYYPLVEAGSLLLFVLFYFFWPYSLQDWSLAIFLAWLITLVYLLALTIYDLRWWILPNKIVYSLGIWSLLILVMHLASGEDWSLLFDGLLSILVGGGIFYIIFQVSEKHIGGGDVKLGFCLGLLLLDWRLSLMMIFLAAMIGTVVFLPLAIVRRLQKRAVTTKIPFGPFLILGALCALWFGGALLEWYDGYLNQLADL